MRMRFCQLFTIVMMLVIATGWPVAVLAHDDGDDDKGGLDGGGNGSPSGTIFPSLNIHQLGRISKEDMGAPAGQRGNDIWGWTDPVTGHEWALVGLSNGTAFVDITDPVNPQYVGKLPSTVTSGPTSSVWRDVKVYDNHAYIVADGITNHGMQIFDLSHLRSVVGGGAPVVFNEDGHYSGISKAHNIAINEQTGYGYIVGANVDSGGLHILDLSNPTSPVKVGAYSGDGYTHDAQIVTYQGPDATYAGREIAFAFNEDTLTIVDVTNKTAPAQLSRSLYPNRGYTHQGWLTEDHAFLLSDDELDEYNHKTDPNTRTRTEIWDVRDLQSPVYIGYYEHDVDTIDHNLYTRNGLAFEANYTSGLRVLDIGGIASVTADANLKVSGIDTVAWIDTHPSEDTPATFDGAWSVYPYFDSGAIIIGDRDEGLVIVQLNLLPGDSQSDRKVDMTDLQVVADHWMSNVDAGYMEGDFNNDGVVDFADVGLMAPNWLVGTGAAGPTFAEALSSVGLSVPEPASIAMLVGGAIALLSARPRRRRR